MKDYLFFEKPTLERKQEAIEYINEFYEYSSQINGVGGLVRFLDDYEGWLEKLKNDLRPIDKSKVPALTYFLVRKSDNKIVGLINIRLELNDYLRNFGGHIGYSIRPVERRKGYNKINLYLGLKVLDEYNVKEALLTCDKNNLGSSKTMLALGGKLQKEEQLENKIEQFYTFDVKDCLEKYKELYAQGVICKD